MTVVTEKRNACSALTTEGYKNYLLSNSTFWRIYKIRCLRKLVDLQCSYAVYFMYLVRCPRIFNPSSFTPLYPSLPLFTPLYPSLPLFTPHSPLLHPLASKQWIEGRTGSCSFSNPSDTEGQECTWAAS